MSALGCPRVDDAASYVLRAMDEVELVHYRDHLADCETCIATVADLGFVSDALLNAVPQIQAPPAIRGRLMATVRAEASLLRAAGAEADRPPAARERRRLRLLPQRPWPAAVLASALLAVGIGGGFVLGGDDGTRDPRTIGMKVDAGQAPAGTAQLRVGGDGAKLVVANLPPPPDGRIYQVWLDDRSDRQGPAPTNALFSVNREGRASVDVPGDLTDDTAVLVTDEPFGGSEVPSRLVPIISGTTT